MAVLSGFGGNVSLTGSFSAFVVNVHRWTLNLPNDVFPYRVFGTLGGANHKKGGYVGSGTIEAYGDSVAILTESHMNADAAVSAFTLTEATGDTWTFNGHISGIEAGADMASAPVRRVFQFVVDGDVAKAETT